MAFYFLRSLKATKSTSRSARSRPWRGLLLASMCLAVFTGPSGADSELSRSFLWTLISAPAVHASSSAPPCTGLAIPWGVGGQLSTFESGYMDSPFHVPLDWGSGIDYMSSSCWRGHCPYEDSVSNRHPFKRTIFKPRASSDPYNDSDFPGYFRRAGAAQNSFSFKGWCSFVPSFLSKEQE